MIKSMHVDEPDGGYRAVIFDLLTALLDSWSLWNKVAGTDQLGLNWRKSYLEITYQAGKYRPYEDIIRQAANDTKVPPEKAGELLRRWGEIKPWPESTRVLHALSQKVPLAVVTNSSKALAGLAVACTGGTIPVVITAEEAGFYKPEPLPYLMALERLGLNAGQVLFVAGSAADVPGASAVGMPVYWHNRRALKLPDTDSLPVVEADTLLPLIKLV